jgi:Zn-dependent protease with chaperone function
MNFFAEQSRARRNSWRLGLLFTITVLVIAALVDVVALTTYYYFSADDLIVDLMESRGPLDFVQQAPAGAHLIAAGATVLLIGGAAFRKAMQLDEGGNALARLIGARWVRRNTNDLDEKRLLNVVEEMAIASGTTMPGVYVMDEEEGINAFAAGRNANQAVVVVTRGSLLQLSRDELQAVIGHEFSHILNGDVALNLRMMCLLYGISAVGSLGEFLLRTTFSDRSRSRGTNSDGFGALGLGIVLLGVALWLIGAIGVLSARLIKAAITRQREFLADASSVQFTRNPDGLAGALDTIAGAAGGSAVGNRYSEELSHMFFSQSLASRWAGLFDTHPPLAVRIKRVAPNFVSRLYRAKRARKVPPSAGVQAENAAAFGAHAEGVIAFSSGNAAPANQGVALIATIGNPDAAHLSAAQGLLARMPGILRDNAHSEDGAAPALLALMLAADAAARRAQLDAVLAIDARLAGEAELIARSITPLAREFVLPAFDLIAPSLSRLTADRRLTVLKALRAAAQADRVLKLEEFVLLALRKLNEVAAELKLVLSVLVASGPDAPTWRGLAYQRGAVALGLGSAGTPIELASIQLPAVIVALQKLWRLPPAEKERLLRGFIACVLVDDRVEPLEGELLRLIAAELDCPMPPLLPQALARAA